MTRVSPDPVPDTLPTLKKDLIELCKKHNVGHEGTVRQLKERLTALRDRSDTDDDETDLRTFSLAQLKVLCSKLHLPAEGTKDELLDRIRKSKAKEPTPAKDDGWTAVFKIYHPKIKLDDLELDWGLNPVILTPAVWPVIMWRTPVARGDIYGHVGTDGRLLEALRKRWRALLKCEESALNQLCAFFVTMWSIIQATRSDATATPRSWMRDHYILHVDPVIRLSRRLQGQCMRSAGQLQLAKRIENLAAVPHEQLGFDVAELAERFTMKRGREDDDDGSDSDKDTQRRFGRGRRQRWMKKGVCKRCKAKATPAPGQTNKEWFAAHNPVCPKK